MTDFIWRRSDVSLRRRSYWSKFPAIHTWYDPRLYKKQLTNNKDPEVDDEPYIVLPPDNTISTKDEAFKLDEGVDSEKLATPKPTNKPTQAKLPTQPPIPSTSTTTKPPPITTPKQTTPQTTLPPPTTTKPTEKTQVIAIQAATPKVPIPSASSINLNLEIGNAEENSQPEQHENVPVAPTVQSIYPSNEQEESPGQPTPQIIIASMPAGSDTSQNPQPQVIMAQPSQTEPQPQIVFVPQPTSQPQYVIAAPQPTQPPPAPVVYQQSLPAPFPVSYPQTAPAPASVPPSSMYLSQLTPPRAIIAAPSSPAVAPLSFAAPQPQVTVSASQPASITVNSPLSATRMTDVNNMMISSSLTGLPSMSPFLVSKMLSQGRPMYPFGSGGLQLPMLQTPQFPLNSGWPSITTPLAQQFQMAQPSLMSPPLLSSLPQGYDPLLYNGLTGLFANAIRSALVQPQPNALASALALAASQAQERNQPPDLLTSALTQALAQNIQQGIQPISNAKLVQALSQALSQVQPATPQGTNNPVYPPQHPPPSQQQPSPPPKDTKQPAPYAPIQIPSYQVIPNSQPENPPIRDSRSDSRNKNYSVNRVGKALATALIKAARKIANHNPRFNSQRRKRPRNRHRSSYYRHYRARSFVPLLHMHSPDLHFQTLNNEKAMRWTEDDIIEYFAMFRTFWRRISSPCPLRWCHRSWKCPF